MSDVAIATAEAPAAPPSIPETISSREAAGLLGKLRETQPEAPAEAEQPEPDSPQGEESADAADERPEGEADPEQSDPAEPSIEPPRSWTKEEKALFSTFPPEAQQKIAETEQAREKAFLTRQNELAEARKALEPERQTLTQQRQQYEQALPALMSMLAEQQAGEFADVKTWDDVQKMADEDLPRYLRWEVHQKRMTAVQTELQAANARQAQEQSSNFTNWATEQDKLFAEKAPEFNHPKTAAKAREDVVSYLKDLGVNDDEMQAMWSGKSGLSLRDSRVQVALRDAARWRSAEAARKAATARQAPPVQRPGVVQTRGEGRAAMVTQAFKQLERSGSVKDAVALLQTRRRASK